MSLIQSLLDKGFVPFATGASANLERLNPAPFGHSLTMCPAEDPTFHKLQGLINQMNGIAYGGKDLGMPNWVQLDCGLLPSAFVGFACRASMLPSRLQWELGLEGTEGFVPVAEAISIPTLTPGEWASYSMCTILPGHQLGFASKLLSLAAYGAESTLGVAQYDNFALRLHTRFGNLEIVDANVPYHTKPENTFVYRLRPNQDITLDDLAKGAVPAEQEPSFLMDAGDTRQMERMAARIRAKTHKYTLLAPGVFRHKGRLVNPILETPLNG